MAIFMKLLTNVIKAWKNVLNSSLKYPISGTVSHFLEVNPIKQLFPEVYALLKHETSRPTLEHISSASALKDNTIKDIIALIIAFIMDAIAMSIHILYIAHHYMQ